MAYNPNAVFLSPSSLTDFEKCPQLYYYRNVFRTPRGTKIQIINPSLALGQAVHDAIEQFLQLIPPKRTKDELIKLLGFIWQNTSEERGGFKDAIEEKTFKERAIGMLERFFANEHFRNVERVPLPEFPKANLGQDIILTGRLDWLEKDADGYHMIDFKTGKNEEREDSKQLPIYGVLVSKIFQTESVRASYWYLDHESNLTPIPLPNIEETFSYLTKKGGVIKLVRQTNSYRCQSGGESCWACQDFLAVAREKGKIVAVDYKRNQEIYILSKQSVDYVPKAETQVDDLPF
jgi:RecB family exonuclease